MGNRLVFPRLVFSCKDLHVVVRNYRNTSFENAGGRYAELECNLLNSLVAVTKEEDPALMGHAFCTSGLNSSHLIYASYN